MGDREYQMAPPMHQEAEPPMQPEGYEGRPEEYGMQPYGPRPEMGDPNSPAGLQAAAHKKKSKWWLYVLIALGVLVGGVLLMGILNQVSKDGSSIAKNIYLMAKYLAYASIIFAGLAALARFAYNRYKNSSETKLQKDEKALEEAKKEKTEDESELDKLKEKKNPSEQEKTEMTKLQSKIDGLTQTIEKLTKQVAADKKAEEGGTTTDTDTTDTDTTDTDPTDTDAVE